MKDDPKDIEWHLDNPKTRKWVVQCVICQDVGYKPDVPHQFFGKSHLEKFFQPLNLNEINVCEKCESFLANQDS